MSIQMMPVGLLCSESAISLTVIRELGMRGVGVVAIIRSADSFLQSSRYVTRAVLRPDGPVEIWLPAFAEQHGFSRVMAIGEADLLTLSKMKAGGSALEIAAPSPGQLRLVLDKQALLAEAAKAGLPVPRSWQPVGDDPPDWLSDEAHFPLVAKWSDPLAVRERLESAGIALEKVHYIDSPDALSDFLSQFRNVGIYPLIQEYCPGHGLGQMFHTVDGEATLRFQHRRLREWPLSGGVSSLCEAVPLAEHAVLREKSEALLRRLRWTGPAMVEYRYDPATGSAVLMEINGRFWGSLPLAHAAGVQFGWETYARAFDCAEPGDKQAAYPLRKARYLAPELKNLRDVIKGSDTYRTKAAFTAGFLATFFDPSVRYFVFSVRDPQPFWADIRNFIRRSIRPGAG